MPTREHPIRRLLARGLLAVALLFAQQTASLHWLSHAVDATHAKGATGSAGAKHCDECLAIGALGAAATTAPAGFLPFDGTPPWRAAPSLRSAPQALRLAFRSRAPPRSV